MVRAPWAKSGGRWFKYPADHLAGVVSRTYTNRRPVSSVGRASDYRAGGLGFETGPTLTFLK